MQRMKDIIAEIGGQAAARRPLQSGHKAKITAIPQRVPTAAELTWECVAGTVGEYWGLTIRYQGCGIITPLPSWQPGRYVRRSCECEKAALAEHKRLEALAAAERDAIRYTFDWLGDGWHDTDLAEKSFDNFRRELDPEAFDVALEFAQAPEGVLVLHGGFGTGKTHLLAAIAGELRANGIKSRFVTSAKLHAVIGERIAKRETIAPIIKQATETPVFMLDDVDKCKWSDWREQIYFTIIDERTKRGLPIAISINQFNRLAEVFGGAVASRLSIGQLPVEMIGEDYRKKYLTLV